MDTEFVSPNPARDPHSNPSRSMAPPAAFPVAVATAFALTISAATAFATDRIDLARSQFDSIDGDAPHPAQIVLDLGAAPLSPALFRLDPNDPVRGGGASISVIEAGSDPEGDSVSGVVFTADGSRVLISERDSRNVVIWNADGTFDSAIAVSGTPGGVAVTPDGAWAVVPNIFEDTASILDLGTGTESAVIAVGDQPAVVAINPSGTLAAIGNSVDGTISILSLPAGVVERTIAGIGYTASVSANFESGAIGFRVDRFEFISDNVLVHPDFFADTVHFVDVTTGAVNSIPVADAPRRLCISSDRSTVVVAHTGAARTLTVFDAVSETVSSVIPTGVDLFGAITVNATGTQAVAAIQNACVVVDLVTNAVSPSINTASVNELHTTADGLYAQCVGFRGSLISYATQSLVLNLNNLVSCTFGAVSPVAPRAAMVADTFGEDLLFLDTNGAAGFLDVATLSGPADEGDKARLVSLSPDGTLAAVTQILSDNVGFYDVATGALVATVATGNRPAEVEWTPDGSKACIANLDSAFLTVVDVPAFTATNVGISTRASQVEISPDGQYAYVAVLASGDGVWRIDLNTKTVAGSRIFTGNMGGISFLYSRTSGMTLSHDGSVLAVCGSFTNNVSFIDTASWTLLGNASVPGFPVRATFASDDSDLYVSCRDDDRIRVIDVTARTVTSTIVVGDWPFESVVSTDGTTLYVLNYLDQNVGIVDLGLATQTGTIALPNPPAGIVLSSSGTDLMVPTGNWSLSFGPGPLIGISSVGEFNIIDLSTNTIAEQLDSGVPPSTIDYHAASRTVVVPSTFIDGLYVVALLNPAGVGPTGSVAVGQPDLKATPHPVRHKVQLTFALDETRVVSAEILDANGRLVRTLASGQLGPGEQNISWDRRNENGERVSPGVYFARVAIGADVLARKLVLSR